MQNEIKQTTTDKNKPANPCCEDRDGSAIRNYTPNRNPALAKRSIISERTVVVVVYRLHFLLKGFCVQLHGYDERMGWFTEYIVTWFKFTFVVWGKRES